MMRRTATGVWALLPVWMVLVCGCKESRDEPGDLSREPSGILAEADSAAIGPDAVLVESVGLETLGGMFTALLKAGDSVPCETTRVFSTAEDDQDQITITLYCGNGELVQDARLVGRFRICDIPPARQGVPQINIRFHASDRDLRILATDKFTGRTHRLERVD